MSAVYNNYVEANLLAGKLASNIAVKGGREMTAVVNFAIGSGDLQASVYRIFKAIPADAVITSIRILNEAVTGGSSFSIGLANVLDYDGVGALIGTNVEIGSVIDLSSAHAITGAAAIGDNAIAIADRNKPLWQLAGQAQYPAKSPAYDICLKAVAMTTGGGTAKICVILKYVQL